MKKISFPLVLAVGMFVIAPFVSADTQADDNNSA